MHTSSRYCVIRTLSGLLFFSMMLGGCSDLETKSNVANTDQRLSSTTSAAVATDDARNDMRPNDFYEQTMTPVPFLPKNQRAKNISCKVAQASTSTHTTSDTVNYANYAWEQRIAHNWSFFDVEPQQGRILLIDIKQQNNMPAYRYLANSNTQNELYEPWSSSKIFAFTGAIAKLRSQYFSELSEGENVDVAQGLIGQHHIADMITSINSYEVFSEADGNSNALATFFANMATRKYLSALFYDEWLKLSTPHIYFKGAYGSSAFAPNEYKWHSASADNTVAIVMNNIATQDPDYLPYRCEGCGVTGNKPMTTLAQAEWLKRLAMHDDDPVTAHPFLTSSDINTLFYGEGHSQSSDVFAGMTLGISTMLQQAIAKNISSTQETMTPTLAKTILDEATVGDWRVFQKIGWGPSETRSTTETVVLAHVCLPHYQGGRSFVIAAQVAVPEAKEENVALAGIKMQALLDNAVRQYLTTY